MNIQTSIPKVIALTLLTLSLFSLDSLSARTWTSVTGKTLEGELVHESPAIVKIKRVGDEKVLTIRINQLSREDQVWLKNKDKQSNEEDSTDNSLPKQIATLVQEKGTIILEDDFNREDEGEKDDLGDLWKTNSDSRAQGDKQNDLVDGSLVMTISPRADHAISTAHQFDTSFKDVVVSVRMNIPEHGSLKLAYNDREDKSVHAGHINGVTITTRNIKLDDERTGRFNLKYRDDKESSEAQEAFKLSAKNFDLNLDADEWHDVVTYHQGETLTVWIDGKEVASFSSPGFAHETKRHFAFAVPKIATVDDLKIWAITP